MEINKYLNSINISAQNEDQVKLFLAQNEKDIHSYFELLWNDFNSKNLRVEHVLTVTNEEEPIITYSDTTISPAESLYTGAEIPDCPAVIINEGAPKNSNSEGKNEVETMSTGIDSIPFEIVRDTQIEIINPGKDDNEDQDQILLFDQTKKSEEAFNFQVKNKTIIIPNAKENQEYYFLFNIDGLGLVDVGYYWFEGLDLLGLEYNNETHEITGIPKVSGDHKIKLILRRKDWTAGKPNIEREVTLIINPDPKSLFKNIPTPESIEYYKPDSEKKYIKAEAPAGFFGSGKTSKKNIVLASQRGRSHAHEGIARDDDFGAEYCKTNGWYIITVADGAGSKKYSRKGSEIACKTVVAECKKLLELKHKKIENNIEVFHRNSSTENRKTLGDEIYHTIVDSFFTALKNIDKEAQTKGRPIDDYSTTLIVSICKEFKFGWFIGAFWVGDGGIGIYNKEKQSIKILGDPDGGEFAGQTRFITMPEMLNGTELYRRLRIEIVPDFTALVLMTDGVTDPKFETDANLVKVEKWNNLWADLSNQVNFSTKNEGIADQLLNWLDFWSRGNHDDRTIAILH